MSCCNDQPVEHSAAVPYDLTQFEMPKIFHAQYPVNGHPLQALQFTLPPHDNVSRQFQRPFFHTDGSIEYPKLSGDNDPPSDIHGYERDASNPWRFLPLWPGCKARFQGTKLLKTGCIEVHMLCNHKLAESFQKEVPYDTCAACPHKNSPAS